MDYTAFFLPKGELSDFWSLHVKNIEELYINNTSIKEKKSRQVLACIQCPVARAAIAAEVLAVTITAASMAAVPLLALATQRTGSTKTRT